MARSESSSTSAPDPTPLAAAVEQLVGRMHPDDARWPERQRLDRRDADSAITSRTRMEPRMGHPPLPDAQEPTPGRPEASPIWCEPATPGSTATGWVTMRPCGRSRCGQSGAARVLEKVHILRMSFPAFVRDQDDRLERSLGCREELLERRTVQSRPAHVRLAQELHRLDRV